MAHTPIPQEKLAATSKYVHGIRNQAKREYAFRYLAFLAAGGYEPEREELSYMAAQAVRIRLANLLG